MYRPIEPLAIGLFLSLAPIAVSATLEVGPGKAFSRIEEANREASPGDVILVHPQPDGRAYTKTAVYVRHRNLTFRAVPADSSRWVKVSGKGYDYSGRGSVPRAIFQFNPGTDNCLLEGFELLGAHNDSHNGAGVRINEANDITVRNCNVHDNDMGIMSNGDGTSRTAINQQIIDCIIHHNGDIGRPGYSHNLYLGGTSVTPFISPVVQLSSPSAKAHLLGNLVCDGGNRQNNQEIAAAAAGASKRNVTGKFNWFSGGFTGLAKTSLDPEANLIRRVTTPMFVAPDQHDYRLTDQMARVMMSRLSAVQIEIPATPGVRKTDRQGLLTHQYRHPNSTEKRPSEKSLTLGAYAP